MEYFVDSKKICHTTCEKRRVINEEEQWDGIVETFGNLAVAIKEAFKPIVKTFQELYSSLCYVTTDPELKRLIKKAKRQQSIRDRRQQLERSRKRQQLAATNKDKSNNWRRLHGLPARRKVKESYKSIDR